MAIRKNATNSTTATYLNGHLLWSQMASFEIRAASADGADNNAIRICSGGTYLASRGAFIEMRGNEVTNAGGSMFLYSGDVAGKSDITIQNNSTDGDIRLYTNAGTTGWNILPNGHLMAYAQTAAEIHMGTSDGSDNAELAVCGGGGPLASRGSTLWLSGNEHAVWPGNAYLVSGDLSGSFVELHGRNSGSTIALKINNILRWDVATNGNLRFHEAVGYITANTSDGSDTGRLIITAGGAYGLDRGARVEVLGNEAATTPGDAILATGSVSGADVRIGAYDRIRFQTSSSYTDWWAITASGVLTAQGSQGLIYQSTADGSDNGEIIISGGGGGSTNRGALINLSGNEHTNTGNLYLRSGSVGGGDVFIEGYDDVDIRAGDDIFFYTNATHRLTIRENGWVYPGGHRTQALGISTNAWSDVFAASHSLNNASLYDVWQWKDLGTDARVAVMTATSTNANQFQFKNPGTGTISLKVEGTVVATAFTGLHKYLKASGETPQAGDAVKLNSSGEIVKCSGVSQDPTCIGIFVDDPIDSDIFGDATEDSIGNSIDNTKTLDHVASTGDTYVGLLDGAACEGFRVCDDNGDIVAGDLLCTSGVYDGHLKKQSDDIVHSYTVGQALQDHTFEVDVHTYYGLYGLLLK